MFRSAADAIGRTALVRCDRLARARGLRGTLLAKLENLNPGLSKKVRSAMTEFFNGKRIHPEIAQDRIARR